MTERRKNFAHNIPAARRLRGDQTPTEVLLWGALRDRQFEGLKFRRQHAIGRFVVDFYCHELRLAIEVDGGVHLEAGQRTADGARQAELEALGVRFFRIRDVDSDTLFREFLDEIRQAIHPSPATQESGEGQG